MHFTVQYPLAQHGYDPKYRDPEVVACFARTAEEVGFSAIAFSDHPAPSEKWLRVGGHDAFDPFAALGFCAAVTRRMRLMTLLLVLPYRNPMLAAKGAATVDALSGGRLVLGVGSGYLRSEFAALGVDFAERGALFTEAVEAMRGIWTTDEFRFEGRHFTALAQTARPRPAQRPHPPLWLGGNSVVVRRRVARYGQGWTPLINDETTAATTRTAIIDTPARLAAAIAEVRGYAEDLGRDPAEITVQVESSDGRTWADEPVLDRHHERVGELAEAGASWFVVDPPADDAEKGLDALRRYGAEVIEPLAR
ncbi:MAG TPA: LLM class F420-dependent oxidoreductase [Pseudonocardia sp.]|uniref:LLM class F420-dependent oxidoreductase n=1 Tax=Pseudonocardia sp. TaxID=60912 RepID=UPI002BACB383|nr:LLM class F420-dependent oxidoreductase [Pseudonocardia sp.]HTF50853.1 LLM class F420-dependent oxidoreductase [Pseudonocardia sp.]